MTTYYFRNPEEALRRARLAGKRPGCYYGGITLPSGKRGWAIYKGSKIIERYAVMGPAANTPLPRRNSAEGQCSRHPEHP